MFTVMRCCGGLVVRTLVCQSEGPKFDFTLGRNFFFPDRLAPGWTQPSKIDTWGFPRKIDAARMGAGIPTLNVIRP